MSDLFDEKELMDRVDGDLEFLEETLEMLEEDTPPLLDQIRSAVAAADATALRGSAHALKGMLANFSATRAMEVAHDLERMGRDGSLDGAEASVERVVEETARVQEALREFLKREAT
jgi:HPt (histidine-containing phosphotransfer) domain-containing protein